MNSTSQTPVLSFKKYFFWLECLVVILMSSPVAARPKIVIDQPHMRFGERRTGEQIEHTFTIRNAGDEPLRISGIRASCGCTTPGVTSLRIPPGEQENLPVRIDLKGRKGEQNQRVILSTNDPDHRTLTLRLSGVAIPAITIEPRTLNLGLVDPEDPQPGILTLRSTNGDPFRVTEVSANQKRVVVSLAPSPDHRSANIQVTPKTGQGDGQFTDVVLIETDHPEVDNERVLVMWQISTGVTVAPSTVKLVLTDRPQLLNRYLMVRGYPGMEEPLNILSAEWVGQEGVDIDITNAGRFGWRIHLKQFEPALDMHGTRIQIRTNAKGFETLEVPVEVLQ
jgi:hypothetical protein